MNRLQQEENAFFAYLLTTISHLPFYPMDGITGLKDWGVNPNTMISHSFDYFYRTDQDLAYFFEQAKNEAWFTNTIFMIHGDHSAGITHQDLQMLYPTLTHQQYQQALHNVPFILYTPGQTLAGVDTSLVRSQVDIKRTVSALFALPIEDYFGTFILSSHPTIAMNPQTFDFASDEGYFSATLRKSTNLTLTSSDIEARIRAFYQEKRLNDLLLKGRFFENRVR